MLTPLVPFLFCGGGARVLWGVVVMMWEDELSRSSATSPESEDLRTFQSSSMVVRMCVSLFLRRYTSTIHTCEMQIGYLHSS